MLSLKKAIGIAALLAVSAGGSANAGSRNTDVDITIPSSIALYCFENVDVVVSADAFISAVSRNNARPMPSLSRTARARKGRLIVRQGRRFWNRNRFKFRPRVNLDLGGVCAYHAIGGATGARVTVEALEKRLDAAGGAYIDVQRVRARDTDKAGGWRRTYRVNEAELGPGIVRGIDVRLRLNLRNATEPGSYSSATDGTFRITVISNP